MTDWSQFISAGVEVVVVPALHFTATTWAIQDSVEKLRWSDTGVPAPAKLADLYKDSWALARRLISRWEADRLANEVENQRLLLRTLGWVIYALGALLAVVGLVMGNRSFGELELTGSNVEAFGKIIIFAPFVATIVVAARARYLVRRFSA